MIEKHGDLNEESIGDDFTNKKVKWIEKNGFAAYSMEAMEEITENSKLTKEAFEKLS